MIFGTKWSCDVATFYTITVGCTRSHSPPGTIVRPLMTCTRDTKRELSGITCVEMIPYTFNYTSRVDPVNAEVKTRAPEILQF